MAVPDPRKQFGNVQLGAAPAAKPVQLTPLDSIQSATLPELAMAKLGDSVQDSMEIIRKSGIQNDKLKTEAMLADLGTAEANIRVEQQRVQQEKGEMWTPEQLQNDYNTRLETEKTRVRGQYKVDWIQDEQEASLSKWTGAANESYTRSVVQPRMADIGRRNVETIAQKHGERASALAASGDILGSLQASGDAGAAFDSPQAGVLFTPDQIAIRKGKIWSDGAMKNLASQDPKRVIELANSSLALRGAAEKSEDQASAAVSLSNDPLRGFSTMKLLDLKNDFTYIAKKKDAEEAAERERAQRVEANGVQNDMILFITDPRTTGSQIAQRLLTTRSQMQDMIKNDPGNPMLDVLGRSVVQMSNEMEQRQRKAESAANKEAKAGAADAQIGDFVASGSKVDPTDPKSRKMGDNLYGKLQSANGYDKLGDGQKMEFDKTFVSRFGYLPEKRERDLKQRALSDDPLVASQAVKQLGLLTQVDSNVMGQLPKDMQTLIHNVNRHGIPIATAQKAIRDDDIRSPEEREVLKRNVDRQLDSTPNKTAPYAADKMLAPLFKGAAIPVQAQAAYKERVRIAYSTNGQNIEAATKDAADGIGAEYSLSTTDGKKVVRYMQPDKFGMAPEDVKYQQAKYLRGVTINERVVGEDGKTAVVPKKLDGSELTQFTFVGQKQNGNPVYRVNVLDKRTGIPKPLIDSSGPVEIEFDPKDKMPAPVAAPKAPGLAERTGKAGNPLARAAQGFNTPNNPTIQGDK